MDLQYATEELTDQKAIFNNLSREGIAQPRRFFTNYIMENDMIFNDT